MEKLTVDVLREKAEVLKPIEVEKSLLEFAEACSTVLGYNVLLNKIKKNPVAKALAKLEIEVIPFQLVKEYQAQIIIGLENGRIAPSELTAALGDFDDEVELEEGDEDDDEEEVAPRRKARKTNYRWRGLPLSSYMGEVPEFVLQKAIQIKKEIPQVNLFVEYLTEYKDPFLLAWLKQEKYYVEVWEEPKFEGRLTKTEEKHKKEPKAAPSQIRKTGRDHFPEPEF